MAISLPYALRLFNYYPKNGYLEWQSRPRSHFKTENAWSVWNAKYADKRASCIISNGKGHKSRQVGVDGIKYYEHQIIWLIMTGHWPSNTVDHRDLDGTNNRWCNLRLATHGEQQKNKRRQRNNKSGFKGVSFFKKTGKWLACIYSNRKRYNLGYYNTPHEAHLAVEAARLKLHGQFARAA